VYQKFYKEQPQYFSERVLRFAEEQGRGPFEFPGLFFVESRGQRRELRAQEFPAVIIAASGMLAGGAAVTHAQDLLPHQRHTMVKVGFQANGTTGSRLRDMASPPSSYRGTVKVGGQPVPVRAWIENVPYSNHNDGPGVLDWNLGISGRYKDPLHVVVHGNPEALQALRRDLRKANRRRVIVPSPGELIDLWPAEKTGF
jgi:metallo-beta-lactamase family protein